MTTRTQPPLRLCFGSLFLLFVVGRGGEEDGCAAGDGNCPNVDGSGYDPVRECGIFMAPSTLGEHTNIGIYTAKPLKEGDVLNYPEIAIPLLFREWGEHVPGIDDGTLWDRYIWEGSVADIESYTDRDRDDSKAVFVPGIGCSINAVMDMNNIQSTHGSVYDTAGLHRSKDPGSGAFCPYHSSKSTASIDIPPGAEIFASYGEDWIPEIPGAQITLDPVLDRAEDFLREDYYPFVAQHADEMSDDLKQALWEFTARDFPFYSKTYSVLPKQQPWNEVQQDLEQVLESSTSSVAASAAADAIRKEEVEGEGESSVVRRFIRKQSVRDVAWLREQPGSYCQDHIKPGRSTIRQAGRGAFAARFLPAGTVIGYSPLIHIGKQGREVYTVGIPDQKGPKEKRRKQYDLVINYTFGHRNSTVMLTPYGGMVNYINHANGTRANVKVRWPDRELVAHKPDWLNETPEFLRHTLEKIGLSFEYVATRDIQEGEEVFMDYGTEWEAAWQQHVKTWQPVADSETYMHHTEWPHKTHRTAAELEREPYPDNLITMCEESYKMTDEGTYEFTPVMQSSPKRVYCNVLERNDDDAASEKDGEGDEDVNEKENEGEKMPTYTVEMLLRGGKTIVVHNVDHDYIHLYDRAYSADWHLPNVFRHEIMIPDDVMPEAWLNGPPSEPDF